MTFREAQQHPWTAIGRHVYVTGADGQPVLLCVTEDPEDHGPATLNAIAAHVVALHNSNLTKRTITASGAARAAAERG